VRTWRLNQKITFLSDLDKRALMNKAFICQRFLTGTGRILTGFENIQELIQGLFPLAQVTVII